MNASLRCLACVIVLLIAFAVGGYSQEVLPPGERPEMTPVELIDEVGGRDDFPDANHVIIRDVTINRVKESGVTETEGYLLYKILTPAGCVRHSTLLWGYEPLNSYVRVDSVNLIRGGEKIPVDLSDIKDTPAPQRAIYWGRRQKLLQLPRLQPGDGIEIGIYRKGFSYALLDEQSPPDDKYIPPMEGEYFDIVRFTASAPTLLKKYMLYIPKSKRLQSEVFNGTLFSRTAYTADSTIYAWWAKDLRPSRRESYQPHPHDTETKVVLTTSDSWESKSKWFFETNRNQFEVTEDIKEKVEEILDEAGASNAADDEKAKILLHWVAQNIRYSGQTMGPGEGFTLHPSQMIFKQRSGVCKDIAGMLVTFLRAAGMESYPAMTMAGSRIEDLPADQFNHCVTALKKPDGSFVMYDPTWAPFDNNIWSKLETEQYYVIGTKDGEDLSQIPYSPPEESPLYIKHEATIDEEGTLSGEFELRGAGAMDSRLRRMASRKKDEMLYFLEDLIEPIGKHITALGYEHLDVYDFSKDMWWEIEYEIKDFAHFVDGGWEFKSPAGLLYSGNRSLLRGSNHDWEEDREKGVFLYYTQMIDCREKIKIPRGYKAVNPPQDQDINEEFADFKSVLLQDGRTIENTTLVSIKRRSIPPEGYPGFRKAMTQAKETANQTIRIEKED